MAYTQFDTTKPDGFYVQIVRVIEPDDCQDPPDERDEGFWPSMDPNDFGYVRPEYFDEAMQEATERMRAWKADEWQYVGVRARARCCVIKNGVGTLFTIDSPGLWGVESDAGEDYINEIYLEEVAAMKEMIAAMHGPVTYEEA